MARCVVALALAFFLALGGCSSPEQRAAAYTERGNLLLQKEEFEKAALEFKNAIKLKEDFTPAWVGLAKVAEHNQQWDSYSSILSKVTELDPKDADSRVKLSKILLLSGDVDRALVLLNAANDLRPNDTEILATRAAALLRLNDKEGALTDAERALAIDPDNANAHAVFAAERMAAGDFKAALVSIDRGLSAHPTDTGLLIFKVQVYEQSKDYEKLEPALRALANSSPNETVFKKAIVKFLVDRGRIDDAEKEIRKLSNDGRDVPNTLDLVQFIKFHKGADKAREELVTVISNNPKVAEYQVALAELDFSRGDFATASQSLKSLIEQDESAANKLMAQIALAKLLIARRDFDAASSYISEILAVDSKNADALLLRGTIKLEKNELDAAIVDLRAASNERPESISILQMMGKAYERQGAIELADERYAQANKQANFSPQTALFYAEFLMGRSAPERAERVLLDSLQRNPSNESLMTSLARIKLARQDWVGAQELAKKIQSNGDGGEGGRILGAALIGQGKYQEGLEVFTDAYSLGDNSFGSIRAIVAAYIKMGKLAEASEFVQSALKANPNNAEALALLGQVQLTQKQSEEARASFERAMSINPKIATPYIGMASIYKMAGKDEEAKSMLEKGLNQNPGDVALSLHLGGLLETRGEFDQAIEIYENALKKNPDAMVILNNLASLLSDRRSDQVSLDRAYQLAQRLRDVRVPQFMDTAGWVRYLKGDYTGALADLQEAAKVLGENPLVQYHLAMTYLALGQNDNARAAFQKVQKLTTDKDPLRLKVEEGLAKLAQAQP